MSATMSVFDEMTSRAKSEARNRDEAFPILAERVHRGEVSPDEAGTALKLTGRTLADLKNAVDRLKEIDRLKAVADLFVERSAQAYRVGLESNAYREYSLKVRREIESETNRFRSLGWQIGMQASESQEAARQVALLTGKPYPLGDTSAEYRKLDAEFAPAATSPVTTPAEPVVSEPAKPMALPQRQRNHKNAEPIESPSDA